MSYINSMTSESNNLDFLTRTIGTETDNVSATSPLNIMADDNSATSANNMTGGNYNYSATSASNMTGGNYNYSATSANNMTGGNYNYSATSASNMTDNQHNYSATSPFVNENTNQAGGTWWPFGSSDSKYRTLFDKALNQKRTDVALFILQNMSCIRGEKDGKTILHEIVYKYNNLPDAFLLIDSILVNPNVKDIIDVPESGTGNTALHIAVRNGNHVLAKKLISAGANKNCKNKNNEMVVSESESEVRPVANLSATSPFSQMRNSAQYSATSQTNNIVGGSESDEVVKNLTNIFLNINRNKRTSDTDMSYMPSTLGLSQNSESTLVNTQTFTGGSSDDFGGLLNTEQFVDQLLAKYNESGNNNTLTGGNNNTLTGGNRKTLIGTRKMTTLSEYSLSSKLNSSDDDDDDDSSSSSSDSDTELSRLIKRQSDEIHERTIKKIMDLLKVDEKTARNYKAALYKRVKDEHPELNNLDRAVEMEKLATKSELTKVDIKKVTKEIEEHIAKKKSESESQSESSEPKMKKTTKKTTKRTTKRTTKALSNTSAASVPSDSSLSLTSSIF